LTNKWIVITVGFGVDGSHYCSIGGGVTTATTSSSSSSIYTAF
jgi:hypothetical protein